MDCMRDGFEQGKLLDGRFLSVSPLNHGSFGMVFTAEDQLTGNDVAIKCITKASAVKDTTCPAAIATDDRSEELAIHSKLPIHSNIVNLIHHFESGAHQYMVLELCSNGDLYEAIRSGHGPLETEHVRSMMLELVNVIDHLHSHGVYHRDVKPENIFLAADGTMKLGDFGLATTETWSTEFAVGSDRYMAPEQYDSSVYGYGYSPAAADIWAVGIVLLNVLFQRNPFTQPTMNDLIFADFAADRQSLFDAFPKMSQCTYNVLTHSLALDPGNRSLGAVREALKEVVNFTTDDETLDEFCTEQNDVITTGAREPLRTPSISSPTMDGDDFPWSSALRKTPQKAERQLSTMVEEEPELFPGSVKSEWHYVDNDAGSLASNIDSGLGMSYKSSKSIKSTRSAASLKTKSTFAVGSLPISFNRPASKSPYGNKGTGFSKSWSDLWEEDQELEEQGRSSLEFEDLDMDRVDTAKPSTPQLRTIVEDEQGSVTPRAVQIKDEANTRSMSPLRRLVEHDKANPDSPKERSASIMDRWSALGKLRREKQAASSATPSPQKSKYSDAFSNLTSSWSTRKPKSPQPSSGDQPLSWRQGSPTRLRSTSVNKSQVWNRREQSPTHPPEAWVLDNNWREHKPRSNAKATTPSPPMAVANPLGISRLPRKTEKNFFDTAYDDDIGDLPWVGGWHEDTLRSPSF